MIRSTLQICISILLSMHFKQEIGSLKRITTTRQLLIKPTCFLTYRPAMGPCPTTLKILALYPDLLRH